MWNDIIMSLLPPQAMWLMLQYDTPEDFVISTGEMHSVRELVELCFLETGVEIMYVISSYYHRQGGLRVASCMMK